MLQFKSTDGSYVYSYAEYYCLRVQMVTMWTPMLNVTKSTDGFFVYSYAECYCLRVLMVTMFTPMLNVIV